MPPRDRPRPGGRGATACCLFTCCAGWAPARSADGSEHGNEDNDDDGDNSDSDDENETSNDRRRQVARQVDLSQLVLRALLKAYPGAARKKDNMW